MAMTDATYARRAIRGKGFRLLPMVYSYGNRTELRQGERLAKIRFPGGERALRAGIPGLPGPASRSPRTDPNERMTHHRPHPWNASPVTGTDLEQVHTRIHQQLRIHAPRIWDIALALHRAPEPAFQEHRAAELLAGELEGAGFTVERGTAGMPTAFVGRRDIGGGGLGGGANRGVNRGIDRNGFRSVPGTSGTAGPDGPGPPPRQRAPGPRVALLLEYDALPGLGHACGHNLIAAAGLGAALAVRDVLGDPYAPYDPYDPAAPGAPRAAAPGTLLAIGTPAEESGGGKVRALQAGVFHGVDAALMVHPGVHNWSWAPLTASAQVRVGFHGKAAHPTGNPAQGVDALAALIRLFLALDALGRRLPDGSHVQGIVTDGGKATTIVPEYAEGLFGLRGATTGALDELAGELDRCAEGVALSTGTTVRTDRTGTGYQHFRDSPVLSARFADHLARGSGIRLGAPAPGVHLGSSDIGDVSNRVPAIHPFLAITDSDGPGASDHTPQFAVAAASDRAREVTLAAAEALARTAADLFLDPELPAAAWMRLHATAASGG
jgi:metal-dependent amidase/aminoacylase/carboxypeptidase family protein